jgi:ADP-ribose pyrophosphatase YjhB (NUDIX family)
MMTSTESTPNAVVALCLDEDGWVLLAAPVDQDVWSFVGGPIEGDETPEASACRHALLDCGLVISVEGLEARLGGEDFHVSYECGQETSWDALVLRARVSGTAKTGHEPPLVTKWFAPSDLTALHLDDFAASALVKLHLR